MEMDSISVDMKRAVLVDEGSSSSAKRVIDNNSSNILAAAEAGIGRIVVNERQAREIHGG